FDDWTDPDPEPDDDRTAVIRPAPRLRGVESVPASVRVHLVLPRSFNDAQQIADKFKDGIPVILNLQGADQELSKRLIDFASGLTYALNGGMQRVADKVFLLTPRNAEVRAAARAARPLAGPGSRRPLRGPAGARRALRTTPLRKGSSNGIHTRRDPPHPARPRLLRLSPRAGRPSPRGGRVELRGRLARPRRPGRQGRAARVRSRALPRAGGAPALDPRLGRADRRRAQDAGDARGRPDRRGGAGRGALDRAPGRGRQRAARGRLGTHPRAPPCSPGDDPGLRRGRGR